MPSTEFNITQTNTYITVSKSGSVRGPWTTPLLVRGMENHPKPGLSVGGYSWSCASGNPSPAFHPNGTLFAAMRQNPCWTGHSTREHIGLWRCVEYDPKHASLRLFTDISGRETDYFRVAGPMRDGMASGRL